MRYLDELRSRYGFALLLPAHPRKDPASSGARKLTLHDVAGSGAAVRGAEVVVAIERLSHGYARLRILKDRDGDLPVGEAWPLLFTRGDGFQLDPREEETSDALEQRVTDDTSGEWRTVREWATELGVRQTRAKELLERLAEVGIVETALGPAGRSAQARCYRTAPDARAQLGAVTQSLLHAETAPPTPPFRGAESREQSAGTAPETGAVSLNGGRNRTPTFGDGNYLDYVAAVHRGGHVTTGEALGLKWLHDFVLGQRAGGSA